MLLELCFTLPEVPATILWENLQKEFMSRDFWYQKTNEAGFIPSFPNYSYLFWGILWL